MENRGTSGTIGTSWILDRGTYFAPSQFEVPLVYLDHSELDIEATLRADYESLLDL
ncbi:unnamed protein product [marine sediment metagenome]|uniref:Uncharacterized protein n=1 Tax=marine sediment metagenome TaxID=412755 RepID=X1UB22_9ZZZZ